MAAIWKQNYDTLSRIFYYHFRVLRTFCKMTFGHSPRNILSSITLCTLMCEVTYFDQQDLAPDIYTEQK